VFKRKVLDHGYVILRNVAGPTRRTSCVFDADDVDPANSARMSFGETDSGRTREQDLKLANYLMKHKHTTPIEMIEIWCEMKLPIFVARQFVRHRTVTINEISGRYVTLPEEWYIPEVVGGKAKSAKQGQEDTLDIDLQEFFKESLNRECKRSYGFYVESIEKGVAPEHARMFLHLNHYTRWLWKQNLHNLMHFMALRADSHAQIEAQKYAITIYEMLREHLPHSMELFDKHRRLE